MHAHTAQVNGIVGDIRMIVEMRPFSRLLALAKDTPPLPLFFNYRLLRAPISTSSRCFTVKMRD